MEMRLIRHATILLSIKGNRILVDPMLSEKGLLSPIPGVANTSGNPLVDLPVDPHSLLDVDALLVTHVHRDHFDDAAIQLLSKNIPVFCQPADADRIGAAGFTDVRSIEQSLVWNKITIGRTSGQHGTGEIGRNMGPVSGFVLQTPDDPILYITGDTIWCPEVLSSLDEYNPEIVVCFAGAAQFSSGDPITMTKQDVLKVCRHAPSAKVIVVHMEAWNHCSLTRQELREFIREEKLADQVRIPLDGEEVL